MTGHPWPHQTKSITLNDFLSMVIISLSVNFTKWSNTLKQFVGKLPTNCLSVFDYFVGLALKGLSLCKNPTYWQIPSTDIDDQRLYNLITWKNISVHNFKLWVFFEEKHICFVESWLVDSELFLIWPYPTQIIKRMTFKVFLPC